MNPSAADFDLRQVVMRIGGFEIRGRMDIAQDLLPVALYEIDSLSAMAMIKGLSL